MSRPSDYRYSEAAEPRRSDHEPSDGFGRDRLANEFDVREYLRILYRWRWLVVGALAVGLTSTALYLYRATPIYAAGATLRVDAAPNVLALDRPLLDERDWMREFLPTELGILESRDLARRAHDELAAAPGADDSVLPSVDAILRSRSVGVVRDTRLVQVNYASPDPKQAADVANALAGAYVKRVLEDRTLATGEASDWLTQQVVEQRTLVESSESALRSYREEHGADALFRTDESATERQNIVVQKLEELQSAVTRARAETIDKEAQYRQLEAVQSKRESLDTLPAIAGNTYIQGLKTELTTLQRQLAQASRELGDRHPDILKLQGAIQSADRKVQSEIAGIGQSMKNDYETARAREQALTGALNRQRREVQALNSKSVEYTALEREAASNRATLDKLLQRSKEASLTRELQSTNVRIVDHAQVPGSPIYPRPRRTLMLAGVASGGLALGLIFLLEIFNTRMKSPDDVHRHLRLPVLGLTPRVLMEQGEQGLLLDAGSPKFAELLRGLRTNLIMAPEFAAGRTLLVTSSEPGEGKTMTAANIAASLARLNQRVLLIDGDLRRPRLHEMFGETQEPGLTDVLSGKITGAVTATAFRKTSVSRLWLMPAGHASRNPADLIGSDRFGKLMTALEAQFDWVVLDSPPVMAVTDPCLIARATSAVLFVVGQGQTSREVATAAVNQLDAAGAHLIGVVLNRVTLDKPGESYLPYYHREFQSYYSPHDGSGWRPQLPDGQSPASKDRAQAS